MEQIKNNKIIWLALILALATGLRILALNLIGASSLPWNQVDLVLNDPCIEAVHARLTQEPDGNFTLIDQGSIAGTWINYAPVDQKGTRLQHGDLVHFGRLGFHFSSRQPIQILRPSVVPDPQQLAVSEEPEQEREELAP